MAVGVLASLLGLALLLLVWGRAARGSLPPSLGRQCAVAASSAAAVTFLAYAAWVALVFCSLPDVVLGVGLGAVFTVKTLAILGRGGRLYIGGGLCRGDGEGEG